jgi:hypothetical protein
VFESRKRHHLSRMFYVGRERGHNEPVEPVHRFDGDMNDTAALEAGIGMLLD